MLRVFAARMIVSGFAGGATVHSVVETQTNNSNDHALVAGLLTMLGVIGAAAVTGYFTLLVSRRGASPVAAEDHQALADTATEANDELARHLAVVTAELQRKEAVIARQGADAAERDAVIGQLQSQIADLQKRAKVPAPRRRRV